MSECQHQLSNAPMRLSSLAKPLESITSMTWQFPASRLATQMSKQVLGDTVDLCIIEVRNFDGNYLQTPDVFLGTTESLGP